MSTLSIHAFSAVRTVAAGHRMVTEGWTLFKRMCEEVGPGELPQLLRQLKSATTPTPASPGPSTRVKTEPMEEEEEIEQLADLGVSGSGFIETPIMIKLEPTNIRTSVGTATFLQRQNMQWMHTSVVCTQRSPLVLLLSFQHIQYGFTAET